MKFTIVQVVSLEECGNVRVSEQIRLSSDAKIKTKAIWLILPVALRSSQRLSHACVSISDYTVKLRTAHYISYNFFGSFFTWIPAVILELIHAVRARLLAGGPHLLELKPTLLVSHDNFADRSFER